MDWAILTEKKIGDAISKMVDKPYILGDESKGLDCLNSLKCFYEDCGVKFPREFKDYTEKNYREKWMDDVEGSRNVFFEFLLTLGKEVDVNFMMRGDLLLFRKDLQKIPPAQIKDGLVYIVKKNPFMKKFIDSVLKGKAILTFPAIYVGNGSMFMIFDKGAKVLPFRFFESYLVGCRRLIKWEK